MPADFKPFDKAEWLRLEKKADELRRLTVQTTVWGGSGHIGGAMSAMDAMTRSRVSIALPALWVTAFPWQMALPWLAA